MLASYRIHAYFVADSNPVIFHNELITTPVELVFNVILNQRP
jgi:hypothetical protein